MKKIITISLSLILLVSMIWVGSHGLSSMAVPKMELNKVTVIEDHNSKQGSELKKINEVITTYLKNNIDNKKPGDNIFEAHELYGIEKKNNETYVYVWGIKVAFAKGSSTLVEDFFNKPMSIALKKNINGKYTVISYTVPDMGEGYFSSVKKIFPKKYQDAILARMNNFQLSAILSQKVSDYFKIPLQKLSTVMPSRIELVKNINTSAYNVNVPQNWTFTKNNNNVSFKKGNMTIGGLDIITNYSKDASDWLECVTSDNEVIDGYSPSGFSLGTSVVELKDFTHYFFVINDYSYDLYFDTKQVDKALMLSIAKSFKSDKQFNKNIKKDGVLQKTTEGHYLTQSGNTAVIKINQTPRISSLLHLICSDELLKTIGKQKLKYNDKVKITYLRNGYNEFVLKSIKKIK